MEIPLLKKMVGLARLELATSRLSGVRSNHLSYKPFTKIHLPLLTIQYITIETQTCQLKNVKNRKFLTSIKPNFKLYVLKDYLHVQYIKVNEFLFYIRS